MTTAPWIPSDTFGTRLLLVRKEKGLSVEQAAKLCGVAQPTWSTWERGAHPRDLVRAVRDISQALGVDQQWLMWGGALAEAGSAADVRKRSVQGVPAAGEYDAAA